MASDDFSLAAAVLCSSNRFLLRYLLLFFANNCCGSKDKKFNDEGMSNSTSVLLCNDDCWCLVCVLRLKIKQVD